jgi:hypothetical protein
MLLPILVLLQALLAHHLEIGLSSNALQLFDCGTGRHRE